MAPAELCRCPYWIPSASSGLTKPFICSHQIPSACNRPAESSSVHIKGFAVPEEADGIQYGHLQGSSGPIVVDRIQYGHLQGSAGPEVADGISLDIGWALQVL